MHNAKFAEFDLTEYRSAIERVAKPCLIGKLSSDESASSFGGLPRVDDGFTWPMKAGYPLHFIGQLACRDMGLPNVRHGSLLFFYDNRHWGYSSADLGHAVVMHQQGTRELTADEMPECEVKYFFGLMKKTVRPTTYRKVFVTFEESASYPALDRELIPLKDDVAEECYCEFLAEIEPLVQLVGGYPSPVQSDNMEDDCIKAFDSGARDDWHLLLQLFEVGDMVWGDAGALYWFIPKVDLEQGRWDRVWMVTQCA